MLAATVENGASVPSGSAVPMGQVQNVMPAPTVAAVQAGDNGAVTSDSQEYPTKKASGKKGLLIVLVTVLVILAASGVGAFFWWKWYNDPGKIALDTVSNLWNAEHLGVDGKISASAKINGIEKTMAELSLQNNISMPIQSGQEKLEVKYDNKSYSLTLGTATDQSGVFYLRLGGLAALMKSLPEEFAESFNAAIFKKIIASVDEQWWRVSIHELMDNYKQEYPGEWDESYDLIEQTYQCVREKVSEIGWSEFASMYRDNPYVLLTEAPQAPVVADKGEKWYTYQIDKTAFLAYYRRIPQTKMWQAMSNCAAIMGEKLEWPEGSETELEKKLNEMEWPEIYLAINNKHQLTRVYHQESGEERVIVTDLHLIYPKTTQVIIPTDSKSVLDLVRNIKQFRKEYDSINGGEKVTEYEWLDVNDTAVQEKLAQSRNQQRVTDLGLAAWALEKCYDETSGYYNLSGSGVFYAEPGNIGGPFVKAENQCLDEDIEPVDSGHPYYYTLLGDTVDGPIWAYALCVELEDDGDDVRMKANASRYMTLQDFDYQTMSWQEPAVNDLETGPHYYCKVNVGE